MWRIRYFCWIVYSGLKRLLKIKSPSKLIHIGDGIWLDREGNYGRKNKH